MINRISQDKLSILLYHGVTKNQSNGIENWSAKHMPEEEFVKQMRWVSENCTVLSMDQVFDHCLSKKPWPNNSVAITFDDGFENNYSVAAPILDDLKIPATFYITSGIVNTNIMFWVDKLEDCINLSKRKEIQIKLNGNCFKFVVDSDERKYNTLFIVKQYCKNCLAEEKDDVVLQVEEQTDITPNIEHADNYKKIAWRQLKEMRGNELFIIGGHSLYHNILSKLSNDKMESDIVSSIELLKYNLGPIKHYSYPEGHPEHFNNGVVDVLKKMGIICCPTAINGFNDVGSNLFLLRRMHTNEELIRKRI